MFDNKFEGNSSIAEFIFEVIAVIAFFTFDFLSLFWHFACVVIWFTRFSIIRFIKKKAVSLL